MEADSSSFGCDPRGGRRRGRIARLPLSSYSLPTAVAVWWPDGARHRSASTDPPDRRVHLAAGGDPTCGRRHRRPSARLPDVAGVDDRRRRAFRVVHRPSGPARSRAVGRARGPVGVRDRDERCAVPRAGGHAPGAGGAAARPGGAPPRGTSVDRRAVAGHGLGHPAPLGPAPGADVRAALRRLPGADVPDGAPARRARPAPGSPCPACTRSWWRRARGWPRPPA